jgi:anti-sigma regulatory factor (Ser/Thr protein kinase)
LRKVIVRRQYIKTKQHVKRTRRRKRYLRVKNFLRNSKKKQKFRRDKNWYKPQIKYVTVPKDFVLPENTDEVMKFFSFCKTLNDFRCEQVHFKFDDVERISNGAITILLSICGWLRDQKIQISGSYPSNENARDFLERSGFLRYFKARIREHNKASENAILERGIDHTDSKATAKHIRKAMKTVWGEEYRNPRLQGMLIELMANTVNHAYKQNKYQKGWYFSIDHLSDENKVKFCFVDNGKGILDTIKLRFKDSLYRIIGELTDELIIEQAFDGKFGSRTRLSYRGRGLPVIRKNHQQGVIKNLKVIVNNIFFDFDQSKAMKLNEPFNGTFYYWELDKSCSICNLK